MVLCQPFSLWTLHVLEMQVFMGPVEALLELICHGQLEWCSSTEAESVVITAVSPAPTTVPEIQLKRDLYWLYE